MNLPPAAMDLNFTFSLPQKHKLLHHLFIYRALVSSSSRRVRARTPRCSSPWAAGWAEAAINCLWWNLHQFRIIRDVLPLLTAKVRNLEHVYQGCQIDITILYMALPGESSSSSRNSSVNRASQNNNNNGNSVAQQQQQRKSSKVGLKQRTPSPTPPSSPVKSGRPPPPTPPALGSNSSRNRRKLQQQQSDPEGIEDEEEIVLVDNEVEGANDAAEEEEQQQTENNDDDTASETGTYTIGKDSPSPDEDQSRRDIDRVFGLVVSAASIPLDSSNSSGNHPQWVSDWAAQVVQQQEAAAMLPSGVSVKPPSHPQHRPPPPELPTTARPRRKLPSLPPVSTPRSRSSTRPSPAEMSDPSDSSLETESFLRDTESVVSAMQVYINLTNIYF